MKTTVEIMPRVQLQNQHTSSPQKQLADRFTQRPRKWACMIVTLILFSVVWAHAAPALGGFNGSFTPPGARDLTILDQNLYIGAEFAPILTLNPAAPDYGLKLLMSVAQVYQTVVASDFPKRAQALAGEIAATQPDLVSLQEVALIRTQVPGDALFGGSTPATDVQLDYLALLLEDLSQLGLQYAAVAIGTNIDVEMPMPTANPGVFADVRLTDHDVILARVDLPPGQLSVSHPQAGNFQTALPLPSLGAGLPRGWCSVNVTTRGRTFRFVNAHLEENTAPAIQASQALELLMGPANTTALPVILVGDFNSDAYGNDGTTTYGLLTQTFTDAWSVVHPEELGLTWGHDPLLADPTVPFVWRLDLVLYHGSQFQVLGMEPLSPQFQATPPRWPSDHAGLWTHVRIR